MSDLRPALVLLAVLTAACGDDAGPAGDAGLADEPDVGAVGWRLDGPDVGFVREESCFAVVPAEPVDFVWGDGQRTEGVTEACHAFAYPGAFVVSAVGPRGDISRTLSVVFRPAAIRPTASTPIAYDADADVVWVVTPDADSVALLDPTSLTRRAEVATCAHPRTLALGASTVAVTCQDAGQLALHDRTTGALRSTVDLGRGTRPFGVVADPREPERFVVTLQDTGELVVVTAGVVTARLDVGFDLRALTMNDQGQVLATRWRARTEGSTVHAVDLADPADPRVLGEGLLPRQEGLDSDTDNSGVLGFLDTIVFTPEGFRAMVPALKANTVTGVFRTGSPMDSQTTARAAMAEVFLDGATPMETFRFSFDDLDYASALVPSALGERLFVTFYGARRAVVLDAFTFDVVGSIGDVGAAPRGLALDPGGERLFVWAELDRQVRVYDVRDLAAEPPLQGRIDTVATEPLDPDVLEGKRVFVTAVDPRMSRTSYLSCASCHLDGEGDDLVWDFTQRGEGLRNTITLRGSAQHFPLHWSGNFDETQDFEGDIRLHQGGTGFLSDADWDATTDPLGTPKAGRSAELDALAAYLASLRAVGTSPDRRADEAFATERARGEALFDGAGCGTCHEGPGFTDGLRHDVGTLGPGSGQRLGEALDGLDTPTLRGLWRSAPYLHDGSAPTLRSVLTERNGGDAHGVTSDLDDTDLDALVLYLRTLDDEG
ncbi:MAG: hypothetical protein CMN30_01605 [Sandaracinus sp.]|nr:hypothetical protein [Sandaracinus sp.]